MLLSPGLINMVTSCFHKHHPWSLTDHSSINAVFCMEKTSEGPGIFRALPGIQARKDYDAEMRHLLTVTLVEISGLSNEEDQRGTTGNSSDNQPSLPLYKFALFLLYFIYLCSYLSIHILYLSDKDSSLSHTPLCHYKQIGI